MASELREMREMIGDVRERGAAAVETAVIVGLFIIPLLIGIVDVARLIYTHIIVTEAAQEGAMFLASEETATVGVAATRAMNSVDYNWNNYSGLGTCSTQARSEATGAQVTFTVTEDIQLLFPFYGGTITLEKTADGDRFYPC